MYARTWNAWPQLSPPNSPPLSLSNGSSSLASVDGNGHLAAMSWSSVGHFVLVVLGWEEDVAANMIRKAEEELKTKREEARTLQLEAKTQQVETRRLQDTVDRLKAEATAEQGKAEASISGIQPGHRSTASPSAPHAPQYPHSARLSKRRRRRRWPTRRNTPRAAGNS